VTDDTRTSRIGALNRAIAGEPGRADLHFELATALLNGGDAAGAAAAYANAARLRPGWLAPLANGGIALHQLGRNGEAEAVLEAALRLKPDCEPVLTTLAGVLHALGRQAEAAAAGERAVAADPGQPAAWINLGLALHALGRLEEAEAAGRRALALDPDSALAEYNLAHALNDQWRGAEAVASFRRAVTLDPAYQPARHALLFNLLYEPAETEQSLFDAHTAWGRDLTARLPATPPQARNPRPHRLKVGYLSPDFRSHSCAYFLRPVFAAHDRHAVQVYAYGTVERPDGTTAWFQSRADHWRDVRGLADMAIADQIRADGIDVLVDLAGHTRGQPLAVFALQPAPVQVAWLGYPATSGLAAIGYRLTDAEADPPGAADRLHTERLVRLSGGFHCYEPPADAPALAPTHGARHGGVTFGSFNNISKINPEVVATWTRVLQGTPGSRLVLKGQLLGHGPARRRLAAAFADAGLEPGRLELRPWISTGSHPLAAYQDIDIALDTFPYNGTTTTFEALWMGVPVVALRGHRHAARVGASILTHLGRPEWLAGDVATYVEITRRLAADPMALAEQRRTLRAALAGSSLCDAVAFTRKLEAAFRELAGG